MAATTEQKRAVRTVLFKRGRFRQLAADLRSIEVLMSLGDDATTAPNFLLANGAPSSNVARAVQRCRRIADAYRDMRSEVPDLDLPSTAKTKLRLALGEEAASWDARADVWEATGRGDPTADVETIQVHVRAALSAARSVRSYLPSPQTYGDAWEAMT